MTLSREIWIRELKTLAVFGALSVIQTLLLCRNCTMVRSYLYVLAFTFTMWVLLWRGNALLTDFLSGKISWIEHPGKRFVTGVITTVAYTLLAVAAVIFLFDGLLGFSFGGDYKSTVIISVGLTLLISLFLHCREFLSFWRKAAFDSARFQRESIAAKYESFKNQVNPMFLFHSLNSLSGLIHKNEEQAVSYIKALADVYRYVLDTREKEIVPVTAEMEFLRSYALLLKIRYCVDLRIDVAQINSDRFILPSAFHMLIENLLPHEAEAESPVIPPFFKLSGKDTDITLEYPRVSLESVKVMSFNESVGRFRSRYQFLTDQPILCDEVEGLCRITLPLVKM